LKIDFATEFCFWTEQRLKGTQLWGLGLAETTEVSNTNIVGNSLSFLMVHKSAPNGRRYTSYGCRKIDRFAESEVLDRLHLSAQVRILITFAITSPETLNTKVSINELTFLLVTHTVHSNARFDSYGVLKSGQGDEYFLDELDIQMNDQVFRA
jgi:hypothetical protein